MKDFSKYIGKYAFISHPYSDNPEKNKKIVDKICRYWKKKGIIPLSPIHLFSFYDGDEGQREKIMQVCYRLIDIADVVFMYGDAPGCKLERKYAEKKKKPIEIFYNEHKDINYISCMYLMRENKGVKM